MIGVVLALFSSFTYGLSAVFIKKKLSESNYFSAAIVVTLLGIIILWPPALLFTNMKTFNLQGVLFFIIAGMLSPGITRLFYNKSMEIFGVLVTASIFAAYPIYSALLAMLLLGEVITQVSWVGILCIVAGVMLIERCLVEPKAELKKISKKSLTFPLLASLTTAFSYSIRKFGLNIYNEPLLGVAIGYTSSFFLYLLFLIYFKMQFSLFLRKNLRLFWKPAVFQSLGWILSFYALNFERVSVVAPLLQTEPLFILLFVQFYLRELEHASLKVILGTVLVIVGVYFLM